MAAPLRGRTRRLLQQQLPPGSPPDFVPPGRPQPLPRVNRLAQVFSTFGVLPVGGRMFAQSLERDGVESGGGELTTWIFDMDPTPQGWVRVLRAVRLGTGLRTNVGATGRTHYRIAAPGQMGMQLRLNRQPPPDVNDLGGDSSPQLALQGELWPVYMVAAGGDIVGVKVTASPAWALGYNSLVMTFYGELLKARNLPKEMEIGHEAALVKVTQMPEDSTE
jgi:hypothetical protein